MLLIYSGSHLPLLLSVADLANSFKAFCGTFKPVCSMNSFALKYVLFFSHCIYKFPLQTSSLIRDFKISTSSSVCEKHETENKVKNNNIVLLFILIVINQRARSC